MDSSNSETSRSKSPWAKFPWVRIVLVASLAVNLLIAGAFFGSKFGDDHGPKNYAKAEKYDPMAIGPYARALSNDDRQALRGAFKEQKKRLHVNRKKMRQLGHEMVMVLRAEPFEFSAVSDLLQQQGTLINEMRGAGHQLLLDRIEKMSPQARAEFADRLEMFLTRHSSKKHKYEK